ncbi:MAG: hypothetical protein IKY85_06130, partial [Bacteroidaceae bacterium]|nr:hypothetical protein [Bacteroidaceae bacterium]
AFACFQGAAELAPCGYFEIIYIRIMLKQSSHNGLKTNGLALDFSTVQFRRWRRITLVQSWRIYYLLFAVVLSVPDLF